MSSLAESEGIITPVAVYMEDGRSYVIDGIVIDVVERYKPIVDYVEGEFVSDVEEQNSYWGYLWPSILLLGALGTLTASSMPSFNAPF